MLVGQPKIVLAVFRSQRYNCLPYKLWATKTSGYLYINVGQYIFSYLVLGRLVSLMYIFILPVSFHYASQQKHFSILLMSLNLSAIPKRLSCTNISMLSGISNPKKEKKSFKFDDLFLVNPWGLLVITRFFSKYSCYVPGLLPLFWR